MIFLDGLRGLAAVYVMVGHARWLLWEGYTEGFRRHPEAYSFVNKTLMYGFSLFKYGHEAVLFFFVLSGFVIHLRYARQFVIRTNSSDFDWPAFVWRRARRLYPPLLLALGLGWLLQHVGARSGFAIYRQATPYPSINRNVTDDVAGLTMLGNLAFVMNTYVPVYAGDGPLWSLKFEWWFYMLYPAFLYLSRRSILVATMVMATLFAASYFGNAWPSRLLSEIFSAMLTWWLGVLLADVYVRRIRCSWKMVAFVSSLLSVASLAAGEFTHGVGVSLGFVALLAVVFFAKDRGVNLRWLNGFRPIGNMSYTLYVTHFPILVLFSGWLMSRSPQGTLPANLGWVFCGVGLTLTVAYGFHFFVELPLLTRSFSRATSQVVRESVSL